MSVETPDHESFVKSVDPNRQAKGSQNNRWFVIIGIFSLLGAVLLYVLVFAKPATKPGAAAQPTKEEAARVQSMAAVAAPQDLSPQSKAVQLQSQNQDLQTQFTQTQNQLAQLQAENEQLKIQNQQQQQQAMEAVDAARKHGSASTPLPVRVAEAMPGGALPLAPLVGASPTHGGAQGSQLAQAEPAQKRTLRLISNTEPNALAGAQAQNGDLAQVSSTSVTDNNYKQSKVTGGSPVTDSSTVYDSRDFVPPNSYVSAKVLVGVDMQTGVNGASDPKPVLFRIENAAIGVGSDGKFQKSDLKGCMVNGAAYGELSSEKVYIKLQRITCPVSPTQYLVANVEGYVSYAGKTGVRGRVISREGSLMTQATVAGLFQGLGQAMTQNSQRALTAVGTSSSGGTVIGSAPLTTSQIEQTTIGSGVGNAANTLADYLTKRAEQYQPVIEMPTGIDVELVFISGFKFTTTAK